MIKSITLLPNQDVFTNKLYRHKKTAKTFVFNPDINIITGRNGQGKSVLLDIIRRYCGIKDNSYATLIQPVDLSKGMGSGKYFTISEYIEEFLIKNKAYPLCNFNWDGSIVHYLKPNTFDNRGIFEDFNSPFAKFDGEKLFGYSETIANMMDNNSAGENGIRILMRLNELPTKYPKLPNDGRVNDIWQKCVDEYERWVNSFTKKGKPSLLIDELDGSLDLDNQKSYWNFLHHLSNKFQVIVVTHSIFGFKIKGKNINHIPLNKSYFKKVLRLV